MNNFRFQLIQKIRTYYHETPSAVRCLKYLGDKYPFVMPTIDHTAYRFMNVEDSFNFVKNAGGYTFAGHLNFPIKPTDRFNKYANWYNHPHYSRMFTSFMDIPRKYKVDIKSILDSNLTKNEKYIKLKEIDQYLAWTCIWGSSINHLAFDLSQYPDHFENIIQEMANDLQLEMNKSNSSNVPIIMTSNDGLLKQASTKSDLIDGIPKAYIEFVYRYTNPITGYKRDGFDTFSANGIFESTDISLNS